MMYKFLILAIAVAASVADEEQSSPAPVEKSCPGDLSYSIWARVFHSDCFVFMLRDHKEFSDAALDCEKLGGFLAMPKSYAVNKWLTETLLKVYNHEDKVWIGLDDRKEENKFKWSDSSKLVTAKDGGFDYFAPENGPRDSLLHGEVEDCSALEPLDRGQWHDYRCYNLPFSKREFGYVCQLPAV